MTVTLYLDIYFLVNSAVNYLLLSLVRKILKLSTVQWRLFTAAACGALWACFLVLYPILPAWSEAMVTWIFIGALMAWIAFGKTEFPDLVKKTGVLWLVSAAAGGILEGVGRSMPGTWYLNGGLIPGRWSALSLLCTMAAIYYGICAGARMIWAQRQKQKDYYEVVLSYRGKSITVTALLDTGNQLFEPYGHQPVHVITYAACSQLCDRVSQVIYIPFQAVGTKRGMLAGIQIDEMDIRQDGKSVDVIQKPWLAISKEPLSSRHQYEMLLHREE
ncbi:MAG: sigma-E processing peptidase SpoIIGA [Lachnospiraceae bacterium]